MYKGEDTVFSISKYSKRYTNSYKRFTNFRVKPALA